MSLDPIIEDIHVGPFASESCTALSSAVRGHPLSFPRPATPNAIVFLYHQVLGIDLGDFGAFARAKEPQRIPVVLTRTEVHEVLTGMTGPTRLVGCLLYGSGLPLGEAVPPRE